MEYYLVTEHNGEDWEDYANWPIAIFDTKKLATKYAKDYKKKYDIDNKEAKTQSKAYTKEWNKVGYGAKDRDAKLAAIIDKYLLADFMNEFNHTFSVDGPLPFNPTI